MKISFPLGFEPLPAFDVASGLAMTTLFIRKLEAARNLDVPFVEMSTQMPLPNQINFGATQYASSNYFDDNHLSMAGAQVVVDGLVASGRLPLRDTR